MLEQIDHRGKRFTVDHDNVVEDNVAAERYRRAEAFERQAQRELRESERAKAIAGPTGANPDVEVLKQ
ncbi:hypothetical protein [Natronococcus wangiae]|uniref:hypothetical protein n=1 Tax=Natronococcus wangiae TaxID=3068275 RepID=UPI00273F35C2|nr:hypothetical protein [Natronococcus sp. AD5]